MCVGIPTALQNGNGVVMVCNHGDEAAMSLGGL